MLKFIAPFIIKRLLKKQNRTPSLVHGNVLKSVAVVADKSSDQFAIAQGYVNQLRQNGIKTVDFYILFPNQKIQDLYHTKLKDYPFNPKSFGFFGQFNTPELQGIADRKYDVLIDLSEGEDVHCELIIASIDAKWKAGRSTKHKEPLLDFMIDMKDKDLRNLIHHLDKYLMNFNKLNAA
jgi:hypothetical protein